MSRPGSAERQNSLHFREFHCLRCDFISETGRGLAEHLAAVHEIDYDAVRDRIKLASSTHLCGRAWSRVTRVWTLDDQPLYLFMEQAGSQSGQGGYDRD